MRNAPIVEEEDCHVYKYSESDLIKKQIDRQKDKYFKRKEYLEANIDYRTNQKISNTLRDKLLLKNTENYYNFLLKMHNSIPNLKFNMDDDEYLKVISIVDNEVEYAKRNIIPKKRLHGIIKSPLLYITLLSLAISAPLLINKRKQENIFNKKTVTYQEELSDVVKKAIHTKYGTNDYSSGNLVHVPDSQRSDNLVKYVDYSSIADYIKNSDNPDLVLYLLYYNYGTLKGYSTYNGITSSTCEELQFTDGTKVFFSSFQDYLRKNGYSEKEYKEECKKELILKNDDVLDNLRIHIIKND